MPRSTSHSTPRIAPAAPPLADDVQTAIDAVMRGLPPLTLFTTLARDHRLFWKYFNGGLLDKGHLTPRQREIVIDRTTALCGAEYEWGVHITGFAAWAQLTDEQITSLTHGTSADACWGRADRDLIDLCDSLHHSATSTTSCGPACTPATRTKPSSSCCCSPGSDNLLPGEQPDAPAGSRHGPVG